MKTTKPNYISKASDFDAYEADITMSNNLMFRSMFFMNDEARHFLAPPLPLPPCESEYFQKKSLASSSSNVSQSSGASSQLQDGSTEKPVMMIPKQRPHSCDECGKTFLMKHHLTTHMRVHTGERPHVCPECGKSFALKHCLSTHLLLHTADRPYKCLECSKTFTLKHHLVSHERVHSREQPFECPECGRRFPQKRHLTTHIKFHSGERPFVCEICEESFSREEHLVMHSRFHGGQRPFICPDCGAGFLRKFELVNHERQHGRNPEACPVCGKEFLQKRTLLVHVRTCGLPLQNMTPHVTQCLSPPRYTSNDNSAVSNKTCKECGETFASVEGLALHLRLHFGDHSFLSDICSLAASLKQSAMNAPLTLSFATKKTHLCSDCGRGFAKKHGLFTHKQRHENGSCKLKPYTCDKCGKSFAQKNHLSLHERQHMDLPNQRSSKSESGLCQSQTNADDSLRESKSEETIEDHDDLSQGSEERLLEENQSHHIVLNNERKNCVTQVQNQSDLTLRHLCLQRNEKERHIDQSDTHESLNQSEDGLVNQHQSREVIAAADLQQCSSNDSFTQSSEMDENDDLTNQPDRYLEEHNESGRHINQRNPHESLSPRSKVSIVNRRHSCGSVTHTDIQQCSSNDSFTQEDKMERQDLTIQPAERYLEQQNRHSNNEQHSSTLAHQNSILRHQCESSNQTSRRPEQRPLIPLSLVSNSMENRLSISLSHQSSHNVDMETQDLLNHRHHMDPSPPIDTPVGSTPSFQHASTDKHQY